MKKTIPSYCGQYGDSEFLILLGVLKQVVGEGNRRILQSLQLSDHGGVMLSNAGL